MIWTMFWTYLVMTVSLGGFVGWVIWRSGDVMEGPDYEFAGICALAGGLVTFGALLATSLMLL